MRLTLDDEKAIELMAGIKAHEKHLNMLLDKNTMNILNDLSNQINELTRKPKSTKKSLAAAKATIIRQEKAKEKIRNAVNLLHLENAKVNVNSVAKKAGVAYNTVKKYSYFLYQID